MYGPYLYSVFGSPIIHSRSPEIHRAFAHQTEQDLIYTKQEVRPEEFEQSCNEFFELGGSGLNITLPLKELAFNYVDILSDRAKLAGAVNTIKLESEGKLFGDNTDGHGLVTDMIKNLRWQIEGRRILIFGAGGAVRGVLGPLLEQKPHCIYIANRTEAKAVVLADQFKGLGNIFAVNISAIPHDIFDLIINGTSMSLQGEVPAITKDQITAQTCCYDMAYSRKPTAFLNWATTQGLTNVADGVGMLVEQAAESFRIWRGVKPNTQEIIKALKE
ncbi:shikimate dehydrogenase [Aurantivibrio infirmus]